MGLAAYPKGKEELKNEPVWRDTVASILKKELNRKITEEDFLSLDTEVEKTATENVLRLLHAKQAEKLALISWENNKEENVHLIDNKDLRESYGNIIGLIAHSHWWTIREIENKLSNILGAPGIFPSNWTIDSIKLACILRIADATQIDDRRAPFFLRTIRKPSGISKDHWHFQQKLYQPRLERNRLIYTSKSPFVLQDVDSWWICFDTLKMIDQELKEVDSLLVDTNRQRLNANSIASIESPTRLSRLITVDGWQPVDTKIKVTNVAKIVNNLGGSQLYGDNGIVPLRELIQNSSDAIRARRVLEEEESSFGDIKIKIGKDNFGQYIEVEDNGIGMSPKVLRGPFLDFGESFWGSTLMHEELPGLESKGFSSTGKYGIGFFSVFMWGEKVTITSKRYEAGRDSTLVLEFNKGASSRPILRKAYPKEVIKDGGTRIRIWFSHQSKFESLFKTKGRKKRTIEARELIESICPSLDCNVILYTKDKKETLIKANDWITIPPNKFIKRIIGASSYKLLEKKDKDFIKKISTNMSVIKEEDGNIVGRLFLYKTEFNKTGNNIPGNGLVTIGGFKATKLSGLWGILIGKSVRASRDVAKPIISTHKLGEWASKQSQLIGKLNLREEEQCDCAQIVRACKGKPLKLKFINHQNKFKDYQNFMDYVTTNPFQDYIIIQDAGVTNYEKEKNCKIKLFDNVISIPMGLPAILQNGIDNYFFWPQSENYEQFSFDDYTIHGVIMEIFSIVWQCSIDEIWQISKRSTDDISFKAYIGTVGSTKVKFDHVDIIKKPSNVSKIK